MVEPVPRKRLLTDPSSGNLELEVAALRAVLGALPVRSAPVLPVAPIAREPAQAAADGVDGHEDE